jgi:hypothetical protein
MKAEVMPGEKRRIVEIAAGIQKLLKSWVAPLQGSNRWGDPGPRALPWSIVSCPVGAEESGAS